MMKNKKPINIIITIALLIATMLLACSCPVTKPAAPDDSDETPAPAGSSLKNITEIDDDDIYEDDYEFNDDDGDVTEDETGQTEPPPAPETEEQTEPPPSADEENTDALDTADTTQNDEPAPPTKPATQEIPDILTRFYDKAPEGAGYHDLPESVRQLVVVDDSDGVIRVHFFEKDSSNDWMEAAELKKQAWGGSNGIRPKQREGDKVTPVGQFPIPEAFYIDNKPETKLDMFRVTNDTYWVDDPDSAFYNTRVEGTENKDWNSAEHMISYASSYKYGFVIGYNLDCTPGLGSAVFFHVAQRNTIGCIGVSEETCLKYLAVLDKECNPHILIVSTKGAL